MEHLIWLWHAFLQCITHNRVRCLLLTHITKYFIKKYLPINVSKRYPWVICSIFSSLDSNRCWDPFHFQVEKSLCLGTITRSFALGIKFNMYKHRPYRAPHRQTGVKVELPKIVLGAVSQPDRVRSWLPPRPLLRPGHGVLCLLWTAALFHTDVHPSWMSSAVHSHLAQWMRPALQCIPAGWGSCRFRLQGGGAHILPW